ncbi:MAG: phosphoribosylglycinamide formyltransferase [Bacteroidota bacterium]|nr:phosphoribosylglycinamide formyltransferase [Bacteroidota bacterium]
MSKKINIAIFASGSGSNAEELIKYFNSHPLIQVSLILSNKKDAYVLERAKKFAIPAITFNKDTYLNPDMFLPILINQKIDFIILAGFLWLIPEYLVNFYQGKIINIHPALLPKFGGKGMYGRYVHEAVKLSNEKETGITIHLVNKNYDEGDIVFQEKVSLNHSDTPDTIASKVHQLEHKYYPIISEQIVKKVFGV